jgi:hypothetical protein
MKSHIYTRLTLALLLSCGAMLAQVASSVVGTVSGKARGNKKH